MPLTNGSAFGSGSCYFLHWPLRRPQKTNKKKFSAYYFLMLHFHHFFQRQKAKKKSQNSRNHGFSCYFCLMIEGSGAGTLLCLLCGWLLCFPTPAMWTCRPRPLLSSSSRRDSWWAWPRANRPPLARQTTFPLPPPLRWVPLSSRGLGPSSPTVVLPVLWTGFRIRIHLIRIQRLRLETNPDPGL